jgi:hypothetical protein
LIYKGCEFLDDVIVRRRLARHNIQTKRKRKNTGQTISLLEIIVRQVVISILILVLSGIIKSVNTPVTNYVSEKAKVVLFQNIELKSLYDTIDNTIGVVWNNMIKGKEDNSFDQQAVPASKSISGDK